MIFDMTIDMELLAQQKQRLLELIWDIDSDDDIWGIVYMIDAMQDQYEMVG